MNDMNNKPENPSGGFSSKMKILIPLFLALCPLFFAAAGFFVFDNGCSIQVNNYSSRKYRFLVLTDFGITSDKQILPLEQNKKILKLYRWQEVVIKVVDEDKEVVFMNTFNYDVFEHQYKTTYLGDRVYTINIPEDKYLEIIMPNSSGFLTVKRDCSANLHTLSQNIKVFWACQAMPLDCWSQQQLLIQSKTPHFVMPNLFRHLPGLSLQNPKHREPTAVFNTSFPT